ncbi:MAG: D-alanine--D-alanine ligase [Lachnospiraceae bacterium]|nr:D-alanine--D-alanine ligase [Lachnospiraceae bacterium]
MKIVVLAGGISTERDVSLSSGKNIYKALKEKGHQVILLDLFLGLPGEEEPLDRLFEEDRDWAAQIGAVAENIPDIDAVKALRPGYRSLLGSNVLRLCQLCDIVFLGLHGEGGEDGRLQALFDLMGIRYTGTGHSSSALCMDKHITKQMFRGFGVPTPPSVTVRKGQHFRLPESIGYPCMVKTCCGGSSVGVYRVESETELAHALDKAFYYEEQVLVERCIVGREFTVSVVDGDALPVIEIAPLNGFYDYKNKYQPGSTVETCPAEISPELTKRLQRHAEQACAAVNIEGYARVDFMYDEHSREDYALEVNTLPGMTPTSLIPQAAAAVGYTFPELCEWLIRVSMKKYDDTRISAS